MLQINGWNGQAQGKLGRDANLPPINALETAIFWPRTSAKQGGVVEWRSMKLLLGSLKDVRHWGVLCDPR
jgi:hypothetical protein